MTEIFSSLYGQPDSQGPAGSSALGFGSGKPQVPQNMGPMCFSHQMVDEGGPIRKPAAMNEPFYLLRELPSERFCWFCHSIIKYCVSVSVILELLYSMYSGIYMVTLILRKPRYYVQITMVHFHAIYVMSCKTLTKITLVTIVNSITVIKKYI